MITTKDDVIRAVEENHIWINKGRLIGANDAIALDIGRTVIAMLNEKQNLLPSYNNLIVDPDIFEATKKICDELSELTPVLYLLVNAS